MSRILVAWELGGNRGHLCRLIPVMRWLAEAGHAVWLAARDIVQARRFAALDPFPVLPCPRLEAELPIGREPVSYADILAIHGLGQAESFDCLARAWADLYAALGPDLLIADHAPFALLAARLAGLKSLHIGDGFTIPPETGACPLPLFRAAPPAVQAASRQTEAQMLDMVRRRCLHAGVAPPSGLAQACRGDISLLATLPELDPYQGVRQAGARFVGRIPYREQGPPARWLHPGLPHVFLYVGAQAWTAQILNKLAAAPVESLVVMPGMPEPEERRHAHAPTMRISTSPVCTDALWPECDVLVSHGGQGTTLEGLRNGKPMLLLPNHVEQLLTTAAVARAGAGIGILPGSVADRFSEVLDRLLADDGYRIRARQFGERYREAGPGPVLEAVASLLGSRPV